MFLRPYRSVDKRIVQKLFYDTVHEINARDYSPDQIKAWAPEIPDREGWSRLDQQYAYLVEYQRQIVGFASMNDDGLIDYLFVHKDFQNKGIASTLLKQLERVARKLPRDNIYTEASITARGFFEAKGFSVISAQEKKLNGVLLNYLIMKKSLLNVKSK
ncbi:MAG TPA: GNAT family N-acetyltransferase [Saprospirales bacterium]|nr:GNAT family N-acetyltransferase [Saprospirales bacterium]